MKFFINLSLITGALLLPLPSIAIEPIDGYYSNDILGAVDEAKERPHHYDYSNTYRYKRTTAQSIHLNQIDLTDLEDTHLSMTNNDEIKDNAEQNEPSKELSFDNDGVERFKVIDQSFELPTSVLPKDSGISTSLMGKLSSTGIINNTTVHSTPRP